MRSSPVLTQMTRRVKLKSITAVCVAKCCLRFPRWIDICWYILVSDLSVVKDVDRPSLQMEICIGKHTFSIPSLYLQYIFSIPSVYLQYTFSTPSVFLQYTFNIPSVLVMLFQNSYHLFLLQAQKNSWKQRLSRKRHKQRRKSNESD